MFTFTRIQKGIQFNSNLSRRWVHEVKYRSMPEVDSRLRLLRSTQDQAKETRKESPKEDKKMIALGASSASIGSAILLHKYHDILFTYENVGIAMVGVGAALAAWGSGAVSPAVFNPISSQRQSKVQFKFRPLNGSTSFASEKKELHSVCDGGSVIDDSQWPDEVTNWLKKLESQDVESFDQKVSDKKSKLKQIMETAKPKSIEEALACLAPKAYVLDYQNEPMRSRADKSDMRSRAEKFGEEVSLLLSCATKYDIVVINIQSPGGAVSEFGLAASHMIRLKQKGIRTIATVDKVAASGGFMMACCADEIVAAPFAFLGSIGVVAEVPNVSKVLKKNDVDYTMYTAGKFKRTVSLFAEDTPEAREKFQSELVQIHDAFKDHVHSNRGHALDVNRVATGEAWLAVQCKEYGLVDRLATSWDVINELSDEGRDVLKVVRVTPQISPLKKFLEQMDASLHEVTSAVKAPFHYFTSKSLPNETGASPSTVMEDSIVSVNRSSAASRAMF